MKNTSRVGNAAENHVANHGRAQGWLVSSLRHAAGAGDQLWTPPLRLQRAGQRGRLIEVKGCKNVWQQCRRADREALLREAEAFDLDPFIANVESPTSKNPVLKWYPPDTWPG